MKNFVCVLCLLTISVVFLSGCNNESVNPFLDENAIKEQLGDLYYVVPYNATADEKNDNNIMYSVPIENSEENYQIGVSYVYISSEEEANEKEVTKWFEIMIDSLIENLSENKSDDFSFESEPVTDFLGASVDIGLKYTAKNNGMKTTGMFVATSRELYLLNYGAKTGFYNQSVWDNFYAQLELV